METKFDNNEHDTWEEEYGLPPRSTLFPSQRKKVTLIFYRSLFVLFLVLTVVLIGWGLSLHVPYE